MEQNLSVITMNYWSQGRREEWKRAVERNALDIGLDRTVELKIVWHSDSSGSDRSCVGSALGEVMHEVDGPTKMRTLEYSPSPVGPHHPCALGRSSFHSLPYGDVSNSL